MKHEGRGVIRIGDKTDHGGEVVSASSGTIVMGKEAALADDKTHCPTCKGQFAIKPDGKGAKHQGRFYAYHGDVTECGARLLSSLMSSEPAARTLVNQDEHGQPAPSEPAFDDRFVLLDDETGAPVAFVEYAIKRADGRIEHGTTNERGETHLLSAVAVSESVQIYAELVS